MIHKNMTTAFIIVVLCIAAVVIWAFFQVNTGQEVYIYYFSEREHQLVAERRTIPEAGPEETLRSVLRLMYSSPRDINLRQTIPEDLLFSEPIYIIGGVMHASFPASYHQMASYEEALFRASLVRTMTGLPFIDSVKIFVDGEELTNPFGEPVGPENRYNVIVGEPIRPRRVFSHTFQLYFLNTDENGFISRERTVERPDGVSVEHAILEQLKEVAEIYGFTSAIPVGTRILNARTEGGICSINLSEEFISNFGFTDATAELLLQSIIKSIMENVSTAQSIQFLIESERVEYFHGVPYFDTLFERE